MNNNRITQHQGEWSSSLTTTIDGLSIECRIDEFGNKTRFVVAVASSGERTLYEFPAIMAMSVTGFILNADNASVVRQSLATFCTNKTYESKTTLTVAS